MIIANTNSAIRRLFFDCIITVVRRRAWNFSNMIYGVLGLLFNCII